MQELQSNFTRTVDAALAMHYTKHPCKCPNPCIRRKDKYPTKAVSLLRKE